MPMYLAWLLTDNQVHSAYKRKLRTYDLGIAECGTELPIVASKAIRTSDRNFCAECRTIIRKRS